MNPLYDDFIKKRSHVSISHQIFFPLNDFQKELLRDSECGFFIKKKRQAGATIALAAFTSYYLKECPNRNILYVTSTHDVGRQFLKQVSLEIANNSYHIVDVHKKIKLTTLKNIMEQTCSYEFGLIMLDEVKRKEMTPEVIASLKPCGINAIWLCTTSLL